MDVRVEIACRTARCRNDQHADSATLLLVAPRRKFEWNRISTGPTMPSTMCSWNQGLVAEPTGPEALAGRVDQQNQHQAAAEDAERIADARLRREYAPSGTNTPRTGAGRSRRTTGAGWSQPRRYRQAGWAGGAACERPSRRRRLRAEVRRASATLIDRRRAGRRVHAWRVLSRPRGVWPRRGLPRRCERRRSRAARSISRLAASRRPRPEN